MTFRRAGNSKTKSSLYIQHYDPTRKSGKRPCYISKQNIALIELNDKRYRREYKPLVQKYREMLKDDSVASNKEIESVGERALALLFIMGWPDHIVSIEEKIFADVIEVMVQDFIKPYQGIVGIEVTREQVFEKLFKKSRFKMPQDEKKGWEEVVKSGRKMLQGDHKNDS